MKKLCLIFLVILLFTSFLTISYSKNETEIDEDALFKQYEDKDTKDDKSKKKDDAKKTDKKKDKTTKDKKKAEDKKNKADKKKTNKKGEIDEDAIFGNGEGLIEELDKDKDVNVAKGLEKELAKDTKGVQNKFKLEFGGSLRGELGFEFNEAYINPGESQYLSAQFTSYLFADARITSHLRAKVEMSLTYQPTEAKFIDTGNMLGGSFSGNTNQVNVNLEELFLDLDINNKVFFRFGQQRIKWGAGYFWNPTDRINSELKNVVNISDTRPGIIGLKTRIPAGIFGFELFVGFNKVKSILDTSLDFRMTLDLTYVNLSIMAHYDRDNKPVIGLDFTTGFWKFDLYGEIGLSFGSTKNFIRDATNAEGYEVYELPDTLFPKIVAGLSWTDEPNRITLIFEYLYNSEGYDNIPYVNIFKELIKYYDPDNPNILSEKIPLFFEAMNMGKHYILFNFMASRMFDTELTASLTFMGNLSDMSFLLTPSLVINEIQDLSITIGLIFMFGENGELTFNRFDFSNIQWGTPVFSTTLTVRASVSF